MALLRDLLLILDDTLTLQGRAQAFGLDTPLLGALPELDSMAVVALLESFEAELGVAIEAGDLSAETFATVGSLLAFLESRTDAGQ